ncbi:hypothetical protein P171DRAFT_434241 [Karstenula rhodostoma CBS 690.94]|uniref:IDI-2 n=1 Tax=Karstenula rhodostoma CBS 690.94 TaxID=1392251 RepID=A0A9P4PCU4_9PLEO|nr:hypothetical protein P171DRAFT_434241 [Karstenula rhodostoma CBS 690.94]
MKFTSILLFAASLASVSSTAIPDSQTLECGELGHMNIKPGDLPPNVHLSDVRTCRDHPETTSVNKRKHDGTPDIFKRDCNSSGKTKGCSKNGYCWKECGGGHKWCWVALAEGWGPWKTCSNDGQCKSSDACAQGDCKDCGCSC